MGDGGGGQAGEQSNNTGSSMIGKMANRRDGKGETGFSIAKQVSGQGIFVKDLDQGGSRQDASVIISHHVTCTSSVHSKPSTSVSLLVIRQALSRSSNTAHLHARGEIGHLADHAHSCRCLHGDW